MSSPSPRYRTGYALSPKKVKEKYGYIPDNFNSLEQVTAALREAGLESTNLIFGIDFTASNELKGQFPFNKRSLHTIGDELNPYQMAISITGKTLSPFCKCNLIPCYGFADASTEYHGVFSFHNDHSPCNGFDGVLSCYKKIVPNLQLRGPTSCAPVIEAAIDVVEKSGGKQHHVLILIADGEVTRSVDTRDTELSPQEEEIIDSIVKASWYPLSIVLVGVGDGPWEGMKNFDDKITQRQYDNFQFVNFTAIMSENVTPSKKETDFALAALRKIPIQYKEAMKPGILKRRISKRPEGYIYSHTDSGASSQPQGPKGNGELTMSWPNRMKIALGTAKVLAYLLEDCQPKIIHRDIKPANILIDNNFDPKVADFGLARFLPDADAYYSTRIMGTPGYVDPTYFSHGQLTDKLDVYSFGVVLLELITGLKPIGQNQPFSGNNMVEWAKPLLPPALKKKKFHDLVDKRLEKNFYSKEMARMVSCAAKCVCLSYEERPGMSQILRELEGDLSQAVKDKKGPRIWKRISDLEKTFWNGSN